MGTLIGSTFRNTLALHANGTSQYAQASSVSFRNDTLGTISLWVRFTTVPTSRSFKSIFAIGSTVGGNFSRFYVGIRWNSGAGSLPRICVGSAHPTQSTWITDAVGSTTLSAGVWYHVVVRSDGVVYVNNVLQTMTTWLVANGPLPGWFNSVTSATYNVTIAARQDTTVSQFLDARVDEITYYNTALNPAEVLVLYNGGTPVNPHRFDFISACQMWLRCGDSRDDATTLYDEIGSNDFTLVGSPSYVTP